MAEGNIFGLPEEPDEIVEETDESITSEAPEAEAPSEGPPEQARDEQGRFVAAAPEEEQETPEEETSLEQPEGLETEVSEEPVEFTEEDRQAQLQAWLDSMPEGTTFAGKFTDPFQTEKAYNESRDMWRRANEARKAEAQARLELQEKYGQLYSQLQQAVPLIDEMERRNTAWQTFAEKHKEQFGTYPEGYEPAASRPSYGPADVDAQIEQRLAAEREVMREQYERQMEYQQLQGAIFQFYEEHPEVEPGGALDSEITDVKDYLNDAWDRYGIEVDTADPGSLNILYEAARDPALVEVLRLNPSYFESAYGMQLARRDAAVISGRVPATTEPVTQEVPRSQLKAGGAKKPFVESAVTGSEAPAGEDQDDPWVRIKNADLGTRTPEDRSIFFE